MSINIGVKIIAFLLLAVFNLQCMRGKKTNAETEALRRGEKVFTFYRASDPKSLDPMKQFDGASGDVLQQVYDTLLDYHYLERPYRLKPHLLTKMPEVLNAEKTEFLFTLKKGVFFHDDPCFSGGKGREMNVDDVIYSIKRFADANINGQSYFLLQDMVVGLDAFRKATEKLAGKKYSYDPMTIAGVEKMDAMSFKLKLVKPNTLFLYAFAALPLAVVAKEAVEKYGDDFAWHPVGTGPFILESFGKGKTAVYIKNQKYFDFYPLSGSDGDQQRGLLQDAGKKLPLLDRVYVHFIAEEQPRMLKFRKGQLDWVPVDRDNFVKMATKTKEGQFVLKDKYAKNYQIYAEPYLNIRYFTFNLKDPVMGKNPLLRKAISMAINTEQHIELLLNGRAEKLNTVVPLGIAGSERETAHEKNIYDVEGAKKLLAQAGFPGGVGLPELQMEMRSTNAASRRDFEMIRANLQEIGIKLKANYRTFAAYLKAMDSGNFQFADAGWRADYPDAENFYQLLYGPNKTPGPNHSHFDHTQYNQIYERIRFMENGPERFGLFSQMSKIIRDEAPVVLYYNQIAVGLYQKWVKNFKRTMMLDVPFKFLNIDEQAKREALDAGLHN